MAANERLYDFSVNEEEKKEGESNGPAPASAAKAAPSPAPVGAKPAQVNLKALTDRALHFFSTASNETLGACLVGLGATTYIVLGRVGLVLIGVVGGIALHATWEGTRDEQAQAQEDKRRKETGLDVAQRALAWREKVKSEEKEDNKAATRVRAGSRSDRKLSYKGFKPNTAAALNELTDAVIRDYVRWWYSPILPGEDTFPDASRQTLTAFILSISNRLARKRPANAFLDFLTNSSSIFIVFLSELSQAIAASPTASPASAVHTYLEMKPESNLASIIDTKHQQRKLDAVAEDILECYLEPTAFGCEPARLFLKQTLAKLVLGMTIDTCSKPEWIDGWIVYLLEDSEPELLDAIDQGLGASKEEALQNVKSEVMADAQEKPKDTEHRRTVSRAQEAMDEAMREAQRLTKLIQEEEERKRQEGDSTNEPDMAVASPTQPAPTQSLTTRSSIEHSISADDISDATTQGIVTPTSSQSDQNGENDTSARKELPVDTAPVSTPARAAEALSQTPKTSFTNFDQILPVQPPTALADEDQAPRETVPLTLHNAKISVFDDSMPNDKAQHRSKPAEDFMIQIEPATSQHPGWMIFRKYADFEMLHEVLRRISVITGSGFTEAHGTLPPWKTHTKASLRGELERYLNDALCFRPLAESEGMKRFLEKERGMSKSPSGKGGFGWPAPQAFETMGKGMMNVLTQAPKEVAGGGKALFGGVAGVLGGQKRSSTSGSPVSLSRTATGSSAPMNPRVDSSVGSLRSQSRPSQESLRASPVIDKQPERITQMERRPSNNPELQTDTKARQSTSSRSSSRAPSVKRQSTDMMTSTLGGDQIIQLPPLPSEIADDFGPSGARASIFLKDRQSVDSERPISHVSTGPASPQPPPVPKRPPTIPDNSPLSSPKKAAPTKAPFSEQETQVTIELMFAIINELYTLSSAWSLRRTLLTAAKSFLLRPGNPQLESIRQLLQSTVLDANTSDAGIAQHLRTIRANSLPTEDELKAWPPEMSSEDKVKLRARARKLLVERGMPAALTGVMGMQASGEALGRVFDCLHVPGVGRGLIFGLFLQGLRAVVQ